MFSLFPPRIKIENGFVTITNIATRFFKADLHRIFKSSRPYNYIFTETNFNTLILPEFFVLELYYILETLEGHPRVRTSLRKIDQLKTLLKQNTWIKNIDSKFDDILNMSKLSMFHFKPLDYQEKYFQLYNETLPRYNLKGLLLAAGPGTGKTYTALATAECLEPEVIVVICPSNAYETVWTKSITGEDRLYVKEPTLWKVTEGKKYSGQRIMLTHYEGQKNLLNEIRKHRFKKAVVILDESHYLNELDSGRTQYYLDICRELDAYVIPATGTPVKALAYETIPLLTAIDPLFTDDVKSLFSRLYSGEATKMTDILNRRLNLISYRVSSNVIGLEEPLEETINVKIDNWKNYTLEAVFQKMKEYAAVREKEIIKEYPKHQEFFEHILSKINIKVKNNTSFSSEYKKEFVTNLDLYKNKVLEIKSAHDKGGIGRVKEQMAWCTDFEKTVLIPSIENREDKNKFKETCVIIKYYKLKIRGECLGRVLSRARIDAYCDIVNYINFEELIDSSKKKSIVFTSYIEVVEKCFNYLKSEGAKPLMIHGEHTKQLRELIDRFDKDDDLNPLITTYASLSTAVPLTMADVLILVNPPYRDYILKQTIARVNRIGTNTRVKIFNINLDTDEEPNICGRVNDIIEWSKNQSKQIIDLDTDEELTIVMESLKDFQNQSYDYKLDLINDAMGNLISW